jgi:hypothetical protein
MVKKRQIEQHEEIKTAPETVDECKQISEKCDVVIAKIKNRKGQK